MSARDAARPVRVAHIAPGLDVGGLEKLLVEFARHADRSSFDLRFLSLTELGPVAEEIAGCGWPVGAIGKPPGLRPGLVLRLARWLRRERIDVIHTHDNGPLLYGASAARLAGVRRIIHTRHQQNALASPRETAAFRLAARLVHRVVSVSADGAALCREEGVDPRKVLTIINGVDVGRFKYVGPSFGGPVVTVARLSPVKGVEYLVRAAAHASAERPDFRLEIAGDGVLRTGLERLATDLGVAGRVRFLGSVRDVPGFLARASLFVLPSLTEGIPVTLLEAMGCGLPIVATRVGGNREVVVHKKTGLLVPAGDPQALACGMLSLLADSRTGRQFGLAGRHRVEQRFDVRRMVAEYERLYLEPSSPAFSAARSASARAEPVGRVPT